MAVAGREVVPVLGRPTPEEEAAAGPGGVRVAGGCGDDDGAVGQLPVRPTRKERLDQMVAPKWRRTF